MVIQGCNADACMCVCRFEFQRERPEDPRQGLARHYSHISGCVIGRAAISVSILFGTGNPSSEWITLRTSS